MRVASDLSGSFSFFIWVMKRLALTAKVNLPDVSARHGSKVFFSGRR
jgi:hypothetical protein